MTLAQIIAAGIGLTAAYSFGRLRGEYVGVRLVIDNMRTLGRHFTSREVVIGCVIPWTTHMENTVKVAVDAGAEAHAPSPADDSAKQAAKVLVSGTSGYRHPFLNAEAHDA